MNRKNLTAAVLAGLAGAAGIVGSAQAVNINPDGLGQVLVYPYYTTNAGNTTVLSVVNTSGDAKAVKVRFTEGENSREVLDFNMYMSQYDVWTAALFDDGGTPTLVTSDTTCTVPYLYGNGGVQEFLPYRLNDAYYLDQDHEGVISGVFDDISRAAEGHFEVIEMGTLVDGEVDNPGWVDTANYPDCEVGSPVVIGNPSDDCKDKGAIGAHIIWSDEALAEDQFLVPYASAAAATHGTDGVPADCGQLVDAWTRNTDPDPDLQGYWINDPFADIAAPSGGLFGGASVVNVEAGTMYSYDARAIDGFSDSVAATDDLHAEPGTVLPSLDSGDRTDAHVFVNGGLVNGNFNPFGTLSRPVDAVSFVFMRDQLMNEWTTEAGLGAATEWVLTFPTKQFYVHQNFLDDYEVNFRSGNANNAPDAPIIPFTTEWYWHTTTYVDQDGEWVVDDEGYLERPCEVVGLSLLVDREEGALDTPDNPGTPIPPIVSPAPPSPIVELDGIVPFELCYETSVIAFGQDGADGSTDILGSRNFHTIDNAYGWESGWARIELDDYPWDANQDGSISASEAALSRDSLGANGPASGLDGLPVTGFAVESFVNGFLGDGADVLANYGGIFDHKYTRKLGSD